MAAAHTISPGMWVHTPDGVGRVSFIEERHPTSGFRYERPVQVLFGNHGGYYRFIDVSPLTFMQFVFNGPHGWRGFGKSRLWEALVPHLFAILLIVSALTDIAGWMELGWRIFLIVFALALVGVVWLKTYHNFTSRTV